DEYELPALTNGNYFTGPNGTGTALSAGDKITTTQTIYVYAETNTNPNCFAENSFEVTINESPVVDIKAQNPICIDADSIQLEATPIGGTFSGSGVSGNGIFNPQMAGVVITTITYDFTDENGCFSTVEIEIEVIALPLFIEVDEPECDEVFGTYSVELIVTKGTVTSNFGDPVDNGDNNWTIVNIPVGQNIVVTVADEIGCENSIEVVAPECICIELDYSFTDITCFGLNDGKIIVDFVTEGATVTVNGEPYNPNTHYAPGAYTIEAFFEGNDDERCFIEATFELTEPDQVDVQVSSTNVSCFGAADGTITIDFLSEGATYTIKKSGFGADLSGQDTFGPGWYVIEATIPGPETEGESLENGSLNRAVNPCIDTVIVTINEPEPIECEIIPGFNPDKYACGEHKQNYLEVISTGGVGELEYNWTATNGKGWEIFQGNGTDKIYFTMGYGTEIFTVEITDENGCVTTCTYEITSNCGTKQSNTKPNLMYGWNMLSRNSIEPIQLYPNPVKEALNIKVLQNLDTELTVEIFDLIGARAFAQSYKTVKENQVINVDFSEFKSNVYYIKFSTKHESFIKKVILDK
ncbi:T9SS type A sorting domain-containing protein, partial [Paucihalobacter sp.]